MRASIMLGIFFTPVLVVLLLSIRRRLRNPEKSFFLCLLNVLLYPLMHLALGPFRQGKPTLDKAMVYAMKKTKLADFGNLRFLENYKVVTESQAFQSLQLTPVGYVSYLVELKLTMCRRLMHIHFVKKFAKEISQSKIREPLFVTGLPRTGTTFLHRLLSLDPAVRAPFTWELLSPIPKDAVVFSSREAMEVDLKCRRNQIKQILETRAALGDTALEHIHEIGVDLPEECLLALTDEVPYFLSLLYPLYLQVDEYFGNPTLFEDMVQAYLTYKETLQILEFQERVRSENVSNYIDKRWVLKCPAHLFHTREIHHVFPDARIVWTHRHPVHAIPSMCSLLKAVHKVYYEPDSRDDFLIGQAVKRCYEGRLNGIGDDIENYGNNASHVIYENLVKDPISVVKGIYSQFGWEFTSAYELILLKYLEEDHKKRDAVVLKRRTLGHQLQNSNSLHTYNPQEFGLTNHELCSGRFAKYIERYTIPVGYNK